MNALTVPVQSQDCDSREDTDDNEWDEDDNEQDEDDNEQDEDDNEQDEDNNEWDADADDDADEDTNVDADNDNDADEDTDQDQDQDQDEQDQDEQDQDQDKDHEDEDGDEDQDEDGDETLTNDGVQDEGTANREASNQEGHEQVAINPANKHVPPRLLNLSRKRKMVMSSDEETEPIQPPPQKKQATIPTADEDLPTICPSDGCNDIVPSHPSGMVLVKYKAYRHCLQMPGGEFTRQTLKLELELCAAIQSDLRRERYIQSAYDNRWLSEINYFTIHHSVLKLEPDLRRLIFDKATKEDCFVYQTLLTDLLEQGYGVELDRRLAFLAHLKIFDVGRPIFNKARPGYYGPKGSAVLHATINQLFDPQEGIPTDAFAPLSYEQYTYFILISYIASQLIADDRRFVDDQPCTLQQAFKLMVASTDAGDALQGIDEEGKDERFDDILMKIMLKQVTELDYLPAVLQPTALAPQQEKGRKKANRKGTVTADSARRRSTRLTLSQR
ncbi:uncharacterized protein EDB91DRAFT_782230 [Suillus paluster]|uniref:uncharacterized protein n=1 Tax=Suillus paluster TaxID=48578 RepID=UPI001B8796D9|nr:uncharacterized protein EDB91DRAFT_782230 [Suillus paluster]KAG1730500.1 hypothetical protein EDB91DRAFT_782230 [Suillus paluster]